MGTILFICNGQEDCLQAISLLLGPLNHDMMPKFALKNSRVVRPNKRLDADLSPESGLR